MTDLTKLGSSLGVPNVQELAKEKLSRVPERYVRHERDQEELVLPQYSSEIPVVDLQKLLDESSMDSELQLLHTACQHWGFFQLINHGVDISVLEKMKSEIQEFFNLPVQVKKKFNQEPGDIEGYGQAFIVSEEQKLDWGDIFYMVTMPVSLRKPHLIPKLPSSFRDAIETYSKELKILAMKILHQMAKALDMDNEDMVTLFEDGLQAIRMNYYPPCPQPELVTGLCPHSDAIGLTILLQVSDTNGLQIKKDGVWIPVTPRPNAFIINIGDILEIVTNGSYPSIEHRATTNSEKERLSIATFLSPKLDGVFGPAPSLVSNEKPAKFKSIGLAEYLRGYFSRELVGRSYLDTMRIS
ncbi:protein SRG1-like isoform X3 [Andrographis paniculata]|uniref:protein SRG1-like isoform X3 n=1 Tax=Andrographis paniculata TaxID=175694 RepID=UPI0021E72C9A|nr:protein SRG1-like isoform X3 [Andrographis paniculata]XP_051135366.1 protein SRG1-like isoform X3 [Andrographis paniculata]